MNLGALRRAGSDSPRTTSVLSVAALHFLNNGELTCNES